MATPSHRVVGGRGEGPAVRVTPNRLACCITELNSGGAERMFVELVCGLDRTRWEPTVISLGCESEPFVEQLRAADIPVHCLSVKRRWDVSVVGRLARELRSLAPDAVQTWLYHANVAGCLAATKAAIKPVMTGIRVAERRGRWRLWVERFCTRRACRHVCVSRDVAEFSRVHGGLETGKLEVIPNGVSQERFLGAEPMDLSGLGIDEGAPVVAWVGRLDRQKDPLAVIEAFGCLESSYPECHLVLAGEGPLLGQVVARVERLGLVGRVHLLGRIPGIPNLLARCCGLMLTSRWEGMPNVVLEAMAAGRPVVARSVEGVGELVENGQTGWLVVDHEVRSLAIALDQLLCDQGRARTMGIRGQQKVAEGYSIDVMVSRYEALWEREILASRS